MHAAVPCYDPTPSLVWGSLASAGSALASADEESRKRAREAVAEHAEEPEFERRCQLCGTTETPKWRAGMTLCNACGLRHAKRQVPTTANVQVPMIMVPVAQQQGGFALAPANQVLTMNNGMMMANNGMMMAQMAQTPTMQPQPVAPMAQGYAMGVGGAPVQQFQPSSNLMMVAQAMPFTSPGT